MIKHIVLSLPLFFGIFLYSCSDDPSSVGIRLLDQDLPKIDSINSMDAAFIQTSSYFKKVESLGNSPRLLVGIKDDITAHTLIFHGFLLPDSIKTDFTEGNITIESAIVELYPNYFFPVEDSLAEFDFTVHKILSEWNTSTFSADSFSTLQFNADDLSSNKNFNDSIYSFNIPLEFARDLIDFALYPDSIRNNGILISPTQNSQKIVGFDGFTPFLDVDSKVKLVITKQGEYTDTLIGFTASDISVVLGEVPQVDPGYMLIQSSLIINSKLHFDLSAIPEGVVINRATMTIQSDSTKNKFGSQFDNTLLAYLITDEQTNEVSTSLFSILSPTDHKYTGEITSILRYWIRDQKNYGLILRSGFEQNGLELFYLYGSDAVDVTKRPYLEITYSSN